MNRLSTDGHQVAMQIEPLQESPAAGTAAHAVMVSVFAAWASAF